MREIEKEQPKIKIHGDAWEQGENGIYRSVPIVFELTQEQFAKREERREQLQEQINDYLKELGIDPEEIR